MINNLTNTLPYVGSATIVGAAITVVAANVLFADIADRVARFVEIQIFGVWPIPCMLPTLPILANRIVVNILSVFAMNVMLNNLIAFPLNPLVTVGLSVATAFACQSRLYTIGIQIILLAFQKLIFLK